MKGVGQGGIDAAEHQPAEGHAQDQSVSEPAVPLALHGQHIAGVQLCQHPDDGSQRNQIQQIDGQEFHQRCVGALQLEATAAAEAGRSRVEAEKAQHVRPGVCGEGGDQHQQQHHRSGRVQQLLDRVDETSDRCTEHGGDTSATSSGNDHAAKGRGCLQPAGHLPGHGPTHLHGGAFGTEGKATADGDDSGDELHQSHLQPHGNGPVAQKTHDVGDAGATGSGRQIADQPAGQQTAESPQSWQHHPGGKVIEQLQAPILEQVDAAGEQQASDGSAQACERQRQNHHQPAAFEQPLDAAAGPQQVASSFRFAQGGHRVMGDQASASTAASSSALITRP